ncbi:MAG: TlpA family protein disulfide reductase [Gammaproteobacteria bacterium]|nr:TlpA family protein disulfide reductase [Gammaproteobacteria bacterium]
MLRLLPMLLLGILLAGCTEEAPQPQVDNASSSAHNLLEFTLPDLEGESRKLAQWQGQVVMVNFWAPWCPPCRDEVPAFIELQEKYADKGFTIVGITVDTHENAQTFADTMGINYPVLIAEEEGIEIAKRYGNRVGALPYTALLDRRGNIVFTHRSELSLEQAEEALKAAL